MNRALYESILNKLCNHTPCRDNGFQSWKKTERLADFVRHLNELPCKEPTYLVLLHVDALVSLCPRTFIVLLELEKYSTCHWLHVTLTSYLPWEKLKEQLLSFQNVTTPFLLWFPNYSWNECATILEKMLLTEPKYEKFKRPFVRTVLDVLYHAIPYLDQLLRLCQQLFQVYIHPIEQAVDSTSSHDASKLYSNILPYLKQRLDGIYCHQPPLADIRNENRKDILANVIVDEQQYRLSLTNTAKLLCIAAYMASHISPKRDSKIFTKKSTRVKKHRRRTNSSTLTEAIPFRLERLLAIYRVIQQQLDESFTEKESSGVLLVQWKTICDYHFVLPIRTGSSLTNPKYVSQVTEETFHAFSKQLGLQLTPYFGLD